MYDDWYFFEVFMQGNTHKTKERPGVSRHKAPQETPAVTQSSFAQVFLEQQHDRKYRV